MKRPAVELDDQALLGPQQIDHVAAHGGVRYRCRELRGTDQSEQPALGRRARTRRWAALHQRAQIGDAPMPRRSLDRRGDLRVGCETASTALRERVLQFELRHLAGDLDKGPRRRGDRQPVPPPQVRLCHRGHATELEPGPRPCVHAHDRQSDRAIGSLVEHLPDSGAGPTAHHAMSTKMQHGGHRQTERLGPWTADQIHVTVVDVNAPVPEPMADSAASDAGGKHLLAMNEALLTLRDPGDLTISRTPHLFRNPNHRGHR
ncbi:MAG: hypothetical protein ACLP01_26930 [Solirubrobacteraceae bacterium]